MTAPMGCGTVGTSQALRSKKVELTMLDAAMDHRPHRLLLNPAFQCSDACVTVRLIDGLVRRWSDRNRDPVIWCPVSSVSCSAIFLSHGRSHDAVVIDWHRQSLHTWSLQAERLIRTNGFVLRSGGRRAERARPSRAMKVWIHAAGGKTRKRFHQPGRRAAARVLGCSDGVSLKAANGNGASSNVGRIIRWW